MRLMLIVNTSASSVTARARVVIQKALSGAHDVTLRETNRRGHAARLAQGAAADGYDVVAVLAGDGTLNEAANGLAHSGTALAVLPGGSTNVFARTIGTANDPIEATSQLLGALATGSVRSVSLGQLNGRYFLFHAGIGFDAAVVAQVEKMAFLKRYMGSALFIVAALSTWARGYDRHEPAFSLYADEERSAEASLQEGYFAICLNTDPYTFLGKHPLRLAPGTSIETPLTIVTFRKLKLKTLLPVVVGALGKGAAAQRPKDVSFLWGTRRATIKGHRPVPYQLDGDYVGESELIELHWAKGALRLVLPR
ncbi:MAG: diacylglycerol/lipid kinase family protein [Acidimicrobiales bacterium]